MRSDLLQPFQAARVGIPAGENGAAHDHAESLEQALVRPGPTAKSGGALSRQRGMTNGHRGWK